MLLRCPIHVTEVPVKVYVAFAGGTEACTAVPALHPYQSGVACVQPALKVTAAASTAGTERDRHQQGCNAFHRTARGCSCAKSGGANPTGAGVRNRQSRASGFNDLPHGLTLSAASRHPMRSRLPRRRPCRDTKLSLAFIRGYSFGCQDVVLEGEPWSGWTCAPAESRRIAGRRAPRGRLFRCRA